MRNFFVLVSALMMLLLSGISHAGDITATAPPAPDKSSKYLFYMHGGYPERRGGTGEYDYQGIIEKFASMGFHVIGEVRGQTMPPRYARQIARQVNQLLNAGVPAANITVAGHSKGGLMTLMTSTFVGRDDIKYGVMAACAPRGSRFHRSYRRFMQNLASGIRGRFLVAWDVSDDVAGNCDQALEMGSAKYRNKVFKTGEGHRLFYNPSDNWMKELATLANKP
ncbi:MAG: hypothetical protein QGF16_10765 [Rhodospirillales bacterium]|nr:hypothetical protein [Rhodospirillales bacterium]